MAVLSNESSDLQEVIADWNKYCQLDFLIGIFFTKHQQIDIVECSVVSRCSVGHALDHFLGQTH